ncbi:hypothetical protein V8G54_028314 [Vigna mungo]|uniref:Uncharacterized protein n=1 Tax=Vigna mungo TaxID=3915 RepID=A0AAQ3RKR5_VIGMU
MNLSDTNIMNNSVLTKCGGSHKMIEWFSVNREATLAIAQHHSYSSCSSNFPTQIRFPRFTKLALSTLSLVTRYHMITSLNFTNTFSNTFHNPCSLMTQYTWKKTFWILAAPCVSIGVTQSSVENFDSNLSILRRSHLHVLNAQWLVWFPGHRGFAGNDLSLSSHG